MPSPDLSSYSDLVLYDADPQDLVLGALDAIPTYLDGYNPQEGDPDLELLGSLAVVCAPLIYAVNRVPNGVVEVLARLFGVVRSDGVPATGVVMFTVVASPTGVEIPAGTVVSLDLKDGTALLWTTDVAVVAAANATTVNASVTASAVGTIGNNVGAGVTVAVNSPVTAVNSARFAAITGGGIDPESDSVWLGRFVNRVARLTSTLILPGHFTAAALDNPLVFRATTVDNWDGTAATPGTVPGAVTVAVAGTGGIALLVQQRTQLQQTLQAATRADLQVYVVSPTVTQVPVAYTVHLLPTADQSTVRAAVAAALDTYLSPDTWLWGQTVRANELIPIIDAIDGVDYVASVTVNGAATYTLPGAAPLADLGTVTPTFA